MPSPKPLGGRTRTSGANAAKLGPVWALRAQLTREDGATWTQAEFAREVGISAKTVSRCEINGQWPSALAIGALKRFAREHNLTWPEIETERSTPAF